MNSRNFRYLDKTFRSRDYNRFRKSVFAPHEKEYIAILYKAWKMIEAATGFRWLNSSYIRNSPSHSRGQAIDLYPDMDETLKSRYAGTHQSDPVLHSREELYNRLLPLSQRVVSPQLQVIIGIESDHLHVQLLPKGAKGPLPVVIWSWKQPKMCYHDTHARQKLYFK